jgi:hypothetical protein
MPILSFVGKRILIGVMLLFALASTLNYVLEWHAVGDTDKRVMIVSWIVLAIVMYIWLPSRAEWDEHRRKRRGQRLPPT